MSPKAGCTANPDCRLRPHFKYAFLLLRFAATGCFILFFNYFTFAQDTIYLGSDTIRVGGLEWDLEKDYYSRRPLVTKNPATWGDSVSIFHTFYRNRQVEQIVFGYEHKGVFVPHGPARYYYLTGELLGKRTFVQGKLQGDAVDYHKNGMMKVVTHFDGDSLNGSYTSYYDNGITEAQCEYRNGAIDGRLLMFFTNGKLKSKSWFLGGVQHGADTTLFESGEIRQVRNYENGQEEGSTFFYHHNGRLETEWVFELGRLTNIKSLWNSEGKPLEPGDFADGNGWINFYSDRGFLKERAFFRNGYEVKRKLIKDKRSSR